MDLGLPNIEVTELNKITENMAKKLAEDLKISWENVLFDGTPGSIFFKLRKMEERYHKLSSHQKIILKSIKLIKEFRLTCDSKLIKTFAKNVYEIEEKYLGYYEWNSEIKSLSKIGFFEINPPNEILINDTYLEKIIHIDINSDFEKLFTSFSHDDKSFDLLFYIGTYWANKSDYKNAEKCFKESIDLYPQNASAYYRIGLIYLEKAKEEENNLNPIVAEQEHVPLVVEVGSDLD